VNLRGLLLRFRNQQEEKIRIDDLCGLFCLLGGGKV